jgi:hypothetical protein
MGRPYPPSVAMKCFIIHSGLIAMNEASDLIDQRAPLTGARAFVWFAVIGAVLLAVLGAFAYVGGWLSPTA